MKKDLVCGMQVDEEKAEHTFEYKEKTYYFCSEDCRKAFALEPGKYAEE